MLGRLGRKTGRQGLLYAAEVECPHQDTPIASVRRSRDHWVQQSKLWRLVAGLDVDQAEHRPSHCSDLPASSRRTTVTSMLPSYHRRVDYKAQV